MGNIIIYVFLVWFSFYADSYYGSKFAGPYDIVFRRVFHCENVGVEAFIYPTKLAKLNRTHLVYNQDITLLRGVRDSMSASVDVSVFGNGGWQNNFLHLGLEHFCSDIRKILPGMMESVLIASGKNVTACPIPAGVYPVRNWIFYLNFYVKIFPYGKYKIVVTIFEKGQILTCVALEVDVIPQSLTKHIK